MLLVTVNGVSAAWDDDDMEWTSRDVATERALNSTLSENIAGYSVPFQKGGRQGVALRAAEQALGKNLVVIKNTTPASPPEPEEGSVQ